MSEEIRAVVHIHHMEMWEHFADKLPTSGRSVLYGTPEMAREIQRLYEQSDMPTLQIMVMGGHEEGLIPFGASLREASEVMLRHFEMWKDSNRR